MTAGDPWVKEHREELLQAARAGVGDVRIVRPGTYQQADHGFTLTDDDLHAMARGFGEPLPIDEYTPPGVMHFRAPSILGWVKALSVEAYLDTLTLFARVDLLDGARKLITAPRRAYYDVRNPSRGWHLSAAVVVGARDRITGAPIGARLRGLTLVDNPLMAPIAPGANPTPEARS